jgi:ribosomal protein S13
MGLFFVQHSKYTDKVKNINVNNQNNEVNVSILTRCKKNTGCVSPWLNLSSSLINSNMAVNKTRKVKELSTDTLHKLTQKYGVTKSGSKKQIAFRLWKLERHVMSLVDLKMIEDFLNLTQAKRYRGTRYGRRKNGNLYCLRGKCEKEDLN